MAMLQCLDPGPSYFADAAGCPIDTGKLPHVLLVLDQFPASNGGAERIAFRQAEHLPRLGYRVSILTFFAHPKSGCLIAPPCPIYLLPLKSSFDRSALRAAPVFRSFLEREEVRLVQTFFESSDLWAGILTKATSAAKLIWSRRDMGILRNGKHRLAYKLLAGMPDAVLAVSEQVRQHAIRVDGVAPERVETIHNGLDLLHWGARPSAARLGDGPVVTTVGNLRHVKGHDLLIDAAAIVVRSVPGARFCIGGEVLEPAYFELLQDQIRRLGLGDHVTFIGGVRDLPAHLATADLFVLPSRSEGFSNAIIEAMAASLPVVATDVGGNGEAVRSGVTGTIVPPEDAAALAEAILEMLSDPGRAVAMGQAGRALVAERFTTEAMMRHIARLYARVLAQA